MGEDPYAWKEDLIKKYPFIKCWINCGRGWEKLLDQLFKDIDEWYIQYHWSEYPEFAVIDIKEKYGTLRVYVGSTYDIIFDMIDKAEEESAHICEDCGEHGEIKSLAGWYATVCPRCYKEWEERNRRIT